MKLTGVVQIQKLIAELPPDLEWVKLDDDGNYPPSPVECVSAELAEDSNEHENSNDSESTSEKTGDDIIKCETANELPESGTQVEFVCNCNEDKKDTKYPE